MPAVSRDEVRDTWRRANFQVMYDSSIAKICRVGRENASSEESRTWRPSFAAELSLQVAMPPYFREVRGSRTSIKRLIFASGDLQAISQSIGVDNPCVGRRSSSVVGQKFLEEYRLGSSPKCN
jgi:hypothetical protein